MDPGAQSNLGVELVATSADPIAQLQIVWQECTNCQPGGHGIGLSDIDFKIPCENNEVTLEINFDNWPEETSWEIQDDLGATVASGGTYGSYPDGSTLTEILCLPDGCYDFIIYDAYSDGICCSFGMGSYSLTNSSGAVLASGGNFGASETTNFCLSGGFGNFLPVEWSYFEAQLIEDKVKLNWETATEKDNDYFQIERSMDGQNWEILGEEKGAGNSEYAIQYRFIDYQPLAGMSYYRLKQVDFNGEFEYSELRAITLEKMNSIDINVYPQPATDWIQISTNSPIETHQVQLLNSFGQVISVNTTTMDAATLRIDTQQLPGGMYIVHLENGAQQISKKVLIRH